MREFTGAFLGTVAAILFVVAIVAFLVWREAKAVEPKVREKVDKRIDEKLDEPEAAQRAVDGAPAAPGATVQPPEANSRPPLRVVPSAGSDP